MFPSFSMDESPVPHVALDAEMRVAAVNAACERLFGARAEEMIGTRAHRRFFQDSEAPTLADVLIGSGGVPPRFMRGYAVVSGPAPGSWETLAVRGDPPVVYRCVARLVRRTGRAEGAAAAVMAILPTLRDPEAAQRHAEYVTLAENFPTGFLVTRDERYALVNQAFASMLGYDSPQELIGKRSEETIAPAYREEFRRHVRDIVARRKPLQKAWWPHVRREGGIVWLEGNPRYVRWQGKPALLSTLVDVTESRQRELALGTFSGAELEEGDIRCAVRDRYRLGLIVGKSPAMRAVYMRVLKAVPSSASVLVTGESGTGKDVVARTIHMLGPRSKGPFVPVNCGAIPSELLESEFFGYRRGAFTGAYANRRGLLDQANGGTLFLDEVAELPLNMQVKLLRFLDDKTFTPIGSTEQRISDLRIIAATNRDLKRCIQEGAMREDFFFRLYIIPVHLPPLRERREDIPLLMDEFMQRDPERRASVIPSHVTEAFLRHDWPGNVRELQNTLQRYLAIGTLDISSRAGAEPDPALAGAGDLRGMLYEYERRLIERALKLAGGNRAEAARMLGLPQRTFFRKLAAIAGNGR